MLLVVFVSTVSSAGEHLFLCGSYSKSTETWRSQICEESSKSKNCSLGRYVALHRAVTVTLKGSTCLSVASGCVRGVFKETQLCLALLYSLLSQYRLREAQELGDHVARLILNRAGHPKNSMAWKRKNIIISVTAQCNTHSQTVKQMQTGFNSL